MIVLVRSRLGTTMIVQKSARPIWPPRVCLGDPRIVYALAVATILEYMGG